LATLVGGLIGVLAAAAVGLAVYGLVHYPGLRTGSVWAVYLAAFVGLVTCYAAAGSLLGRLGNPSVRWVGVLGGAPAAVLGWWTASSNGVLSSAVVIFVAVPCALAAVYVARRHRGAGEAAVAAGCASLTAGLVTFLAYVLTTYLTDGGAVTPLLLRQFAQSGAHDYRSWAIGDSLGGAVVLLLFIPLVAGALGLLCAWLAQPRGRFEAPAS
jgi:hypothetical protein